MRNMKGNEPASIMKRDEIRKVGGREEQWRARGCGLWVWVDEGVLCESWRSSECYGPTVADRGVLVLRWQSGKQELPLSEEFGCDQCTIIMSTGDINVSNLRSLVDGESISSRHIIQRSSRL